MVRKDSKGRTLKPNESQRPDGRYQYKYSDNGKFKYLYSWTLTKNDVPPKGKRQDLCLREKIKLLEKNIYNGIDITNTKQKFTLKDYYTRCMKTKNLKPLTVDIYNDVFRLYIEPYLGSMKLSDIKYSNIKELYCSLLNNGLSLGTIKNIQNVIHPLFDEGVRDDIILKNPADGAVQSAQQLCKIKKSEPRHALQPDEQTVFLEYLKNTRKFRHWIPIFVFMFGTGCRIGETLALKWQDIDFDNNVVNIRHTLWYSRSHNGKHLGSPRTSAGVRTIPLLREVKLQLLSLKAMQMRTGLFCMEIIDNYSDFIFLSRTGKIISSNGVNNAIKRIVNSYNKAERKLAVSENREPYILPTFSCHTIRHSFCSRYCENETNVKVIQTIMGHANIKTTLDVYSEISEKKKQESFADFENKVKLLG